MPAPSDALTQYVDALERERKEPDLNSEVKDAALRDLRGVGAIIVPVDSGEWTLRADRDEDGPFIAASFAASP